MQMYLKYLKIQECLILVTSSPTLHSRSLNFSLEFIGLFSASQDEHNCAPMIISSDDMNAFPAAFPMMDLYLSLDLQ